ncbi:hypothetical protein BC835DRAFT_1304550 [Cytidiella melzeri]|nr:hypothetical protein BC835DRAFT_1304550 [Cytidiella melzeri]
MGRGNAQTLPQRGGHVKTSKGGRDLVDLRKFSKGFSFCGTDRWEGERLVNLAFSTLLAPNLVNAARIDADFNNPRGPIGRTNAFARHLETLDHGAIAAKMVQIIDFMASLQMDTATFLHYLRWNLEIPGCMVHKQSVIRYLKTLAQVAISAQ